jgi:hypothetical protein
MRCRSLLSGLVAAMIVSAPAAQAAPRPKTKQEEKKKERRERKERDADRSHAASAIVLDASPTPEVHVHSDSCGHLENAAPTRVGFVPVDVGATTTTTTTTTTPRASTYSAYAPTDSAAATGRVVGGPVRAGFTPLVGFDSDQRDALRGRLVFFGEAAIDASTADRVPTASLAGSMRFDGPQWGFVLAARSLRIGSQDPPDLIATTALYGTYALFNGDYGRVRLEMGATSRHDAGLSLVGPSFGLSGDVGLFFNFGLEGSFHVTPFPYRASEWRLGGNLAYGAASAHLGVRRLVLDDTGVNPEGGRVVVSAAPYAAMSWAF